MTTEDLISSPQLVSSRVGGPQLDTGGSTRQEPCTRDFYLELDLEAISCNISGSRPGGVNT